MQVSLEAVCSPPGMSGWRRLTRALLAPATAFSRGGFSYSSSTAQCLPLRSAASQTATARCQPPRRRAAPRLLCDGQRPLVWPLHLRQCHGVAAAAAMTQASTNDPASLDSPDGATQESAAAAQAAPDATAQHTKLPSGLRPCWHAFMGQLWDRGLFEEDACSDR